MANLNNGEPPNTSAAVPSKDEPSSAPPEATPPPRGSDKAEKKTAAGSGYSAGQVVALLLAGGASYLWLQRRPETPLGGAGGAIFPVLVVITLLYFAAAWLGPILDENLFNKSNARKLRAQRFGGPFLRDVVRARDKAAGRLGKDALARLDAAIDALEHALDGSDAEAMEKSLHDLETVYGELLHRKRKGLFRDFTESIGGALLIALLLRLFVLEAFKIPSGSMIPTLAIGDHIFVNKFAYGLTIPFASPPKKLFMLKDPQPGDVVVFIAPEPADNAGEDFIKRVVAVAGQKIKLKDGVLFVDGKEYERSPGKTLEYQDSMESGRNCLRRSATEHTENTHGVSHSVLYDSFGVHDFPNGYPPTLNGMKCTTEECEVQPGYIFCMGDNRDNSADSRRWGAVPLQNVKGKAMFIWMSMDNCPKPGFLSSIRWERLGKGIQ